MEKKSTTLTRLLCNQSTPPPNKCRVVQIFALLLFLFILAAPQSALAQLAQDDAGCYLISSPEDLKEFTTLANSGSDTTNLNARLTAGFDLDISNGWDALCKDGSVDTGEGGYVGTFDGGGCTITLTGDGQSFNALFGVVAGGGRIKNLTVKADGLTVAGGSLIVQANHGTLENCKTNGTVTVSEGNGKKFAAIAVSNAGDIIGCTNECDITMMTGGANTLAGIAADNSAQGDITGCVNEGDIIVNNGDGNVVGGIAARNNIDGASGGTEDAPWISACVNNGGITVGGGVSYAGGIVGESSDGLIIGCTNAGGILVTGDGSRAGGILGDGSGGSISGCANSVDVAVKNGWGSAGGIAGGFEGVVITNCTNSGNITAENAPSYAGGIAGSGMMDAARISRIEGCLSGGTISGYNAGGIIGGAGEVALADSLNTGTVTSSYTAGGVAGSANSNNVSNCGWVDGNGTAVYGIARDAADDLFNPVPSDTGTVKLTAEAAESAAGSMTVALKEESISVVEKATGTFELNCSADYATVTKADPEDETIATAQYSGTTVTVTGAAEGRTWIGIEVTQNQTIDFSTQQPKALDAQRTHYLTGAVTVTPATPAPGGDDTPAAGGSGGGGCSSGLGALPLLALAPLFAALRRKKK